MRCVPQAMAADRSGYAAFAREAADPVTEVVSVDLFDTLLLRGLKPEAHRFLDIGRRQLPVLRDAGLPVAATARDVLHARLEAASAAYRQCRPVDGVREAKYADIAGTMLILLGLSPSLALIDRMRGEELAYEAEVLRPNPVLVATLRAAKASGRRVIAVSDMYLDGASLRRLVEGTVGPGLIDTVYSSADHGFGKASGRLFPAVVGALGVSPPALVHCGDNPNADVRQALAAGLRAVHVPRPRLWLRANGAWAWAFARASGVPA